MEDHILLQLKQDMGFDQMRFYCFKKSVGKVLNIMTKLNPEGEVVVNYFTRQLVHKITWRYIESVPRVWLEVDQVEQHLSN